MDSKEPTQHVIEYGSHQITVTVLFRDRQRLSIEVRPSGEVIAKAPKHISEAHLLKGLVGKAGWILKQQDFFAKYRPKTPPRLYLVGETHLYLGRQYRLQIIESTKPFEWGVKLSRGTMQVTLKTNNPQSIAKRIQAFYAERAKFHFEQMLEDVLPRFKSYDLPFIEISIRSMARRWGSCSPDGHILLNPSLVKAPKACIEYVIVHELCHLVVRNHTKEFYLLQESLMPQWMKWKERLEYVLS